MDECEECQGHGEVDCPECDATGIDPDDESLSCEGCDGAGSIECSDCGGWGQRGSA